MSIIEQSRIEQRGCMISNVPGCFVPDAAARIESRFESDHNGLRQTSSPVTTAPRSCHLHSVLTPETSHTRCRGPAESLYAALLIEESQETDTAFSYFQKDPFPHSSKSPSLVRRSPSDPGPGKDREMDRIMQEIRRSKRVIY